MIQGCTCLQLRFLLVLLLLPDLNAMFVVLIPSVDDQSIGKIDFGRMRRRGVHKMLVEPLKGNELGP